MARYKVLAKSYINHAIREVGDEIDYDGIPGTALKPLDADAKKAAAEADAARRAAAEKRPAAGPLVLSTEVPAKAAAKPAPKARAKREKK